jgi:hypothetical protein
MNRRRPFGVTVIAIVYLTNAVASVVRTDFSNATVDYVMNDAGYLDLLQVLIASIGLLLGIGLWTLQRWAWVATMLWAGVTMVTALLAYFRGDPQFVSMALSVVVVFYLNSREVQGVFHPELLAEELPDE